MKTYFFDKNTVAPSVSRQTNKKENPSLSITTMSPEKFEDYFVLTATTVSLAAIVTAIFF